MTNRQIRALCHGGMLMLVAIDWRYMGAGLFLVLMDFVMGAHSSTVEHKTLKASNK